MSEENIQTEATKKISDQIEQFLRELVATQQKLIQVQQSHRVALLSSDMEQATEWANQERRIQQKLVSLLTQRKQLMQIMKQQGATGSTLYQQCASQNLHRNPSLRRLFDLSRNVAQNLRQQTWSLWSFTQRAARFYQTSIDIISQGNQYQPSYQQYLTDKENQGGGSLLDASI